MCIEAPNGGGGMDVYHISVHLYIDQSGVVRACLNRIPERQCWSCKFIYSGVNSSVGVLNVVGIHEPLYE